MSRYASEMDHGGEAARDGARYTRVPPRDSAPRPLSAPRRAESQPLSPRDLALPVKGRKPRLAEPPSSLEGGPPSSVRFSVGGREPSPSSAGKRKAEDPSRVAARGPPGGLSTERPPLPKRDDVVVGLSAGRALPRSRKSAPSTSLLTPLGADKGRITADALKLLGVVPPQAGPSLLAAQTQVLEHTAHILQVMSSFSSTADPTPLKEQISELQSQLRQYEEADIRRCARIADLKRQRGELLTRLSEKDEFYRQVVTDMRHGEPPTNWEWWVDRCYRRLAPGPPGGDGDERMPDGEELPDGEEGAEVIE